MKFKPGDIITDSPNFLDFTLYAYIISNDLSLYHIAWKFNEDEYIDGYPIESEDSSNQLLTNIFSYE